MSTASIRLLPRASHDTLRRYVFSDRSHAMQWLTQGWVKPEDYMVEPVEVSDLCRCTRCDGSGFTQAVKATGSKMTVPEFLESTP